MRYDKLKGFALGVAACLVVSTLTIPSFAASVKKQLTAYYNDIKLIINGETVTPKDVNGTVVEPFVIDGTTYLPVRAVAEALGQNVSWDGVTHSVIIGANEEYEQPTIWLDDMNPTSGDSYDRGDSVKDNLGNTYEHYLDVSEISYALNGQYEKFTGSLVLKEYYKDYEFCSKMVVLLDGVEVYESSVFTKDSFPEEFEIDVTDGNLLEIHLMGDFEGFNSEHYHGSFSSDRTITSCVVNAGLWAAK